MHTTLPIEIAATIPAAPATPHVLSAKAETTSVAMVIPEMGLFELPTSPTMRAETAAKKNPKSAMRSAPPTPTGTDGTHAMNTMTHTTPITT